MKYEYKTVTENITIEVDEHFHDILIALDNEAYNSDRKHERRHPVSLDDADYEGEWFSDGTDILSDLIRKESHVRLHAAISKLTPNQQALIHQIFYEGVSPSDVAKRDGIDKSAISHRIALVYKRLKKILE